jgi:fumarate hydratase class II
VIANFNVGKELMPHEIIDTLAMIKLACSYTNVHLGYLDEKIGKAINQACNEILQGKFDDQFPLKI